MTTSVCSSVCLNSRCTMSLRAGELRGARDQVGALTVYRSNAVAEGCTQHPPLPAPPADGETPHGP
jgi:hypothetical protein